MVFLSGYRLLNHIYFTDYSSITPRHRRLGNSGDGKDKVHSIYLRKSSQVIYKKNWIKLIRIIPVHNRKRFCSYVKYYTKNLSII